MRTFLILPLLLALLPASALAYTDYNLGGIILRERIAGEKFKDYDFDTKGEATVTSDFTEKQMESVLSSMEYWMQRLPSAQEPKIILNLAKRINPDIKKRLTAYNWSPDNALDNGDVYNYLVNGAYRKPSSDYGYHTEIIFGQEYDEAPTRLLMDDRSITSTMHHEFMHALGMGGGISNWSNSTTTADWRLTAGNLAWASGLHDIYGKKGRVDGTMHVVRDSGSNSGDFVLTKENANVFTLAPGQKNFFATFHGKNVDALTNGKGMPVMGGSNNNYEVDGGNVLGHPALLGSIMSYAPLRNMPFTELELAVLKDMGYDINLKKSFGKSYYATNLGGALTQEEDAQHGYLEETALTVTNTAGFDSNYDYGVGLHVYRDKLNVTQAADIKASGSGAGGIRVDGVGNTVTVAKGVNVSANGAYGTGILVSYGKGNVVNSRGSVQATGDNGIGAHFGIGMSSSYAYEVPNEGLDNDNKVVTSTNSDDIYFKTKMNSDLNGALVDKFNVSGLLEGYNSAILVDGDAHVKQINLSNGADLRGDIYVVWNPFAYKGKEGTALAKNAAELEKYSTKLNVGTHEDGITADTNFRMRYTGTIDGRTYKNNGAEKQSTLDMTIQGGSLTFNGAAHVWKGAVAEGATLSGNNTFDIYAYNGVGHFQNAGTISPGESIGRILIDGAYTQTATGTLHMELNATQNDTFVVKGTSTLAPGSSMTLAMLPDYYISGTQRVLTNQVLFEGTLDQNKLNRSLTELRSPTLNASLDTITTASAITVTRHANAYSQYANTSNAHGAGAALDGLANTALGDMRTLITTLDFSAVGGSNIRSTLPQLSPAPYGYTAQASAEANLMVGRLALTQLRALTMSTGNSAAPLTASAASETSGMAGGDLAPSAPRGQGWTAFVTPFASTSAQQQSGNIQGYNSSQAGSMGGFIRQQDALSFGVYTAFARRQVNTWTTAGAQALGTSLHVGGMAQWKPEPTGWHVFAQAQLGMENTDGQRDVEILGYSRKNKSFSTAFAGTAMLGSGWQWQRDSLSFGPYVGLEYALNMLPANSEWEGQATRLSMDAFTRNDLRGVLGVNMEWSKELGDASEGRKLKASLDAAWRHDMLNAEYTMRSSYVGYGAQAFDTTIERRGQGSLGIMGSLQLDVRKDVSLGLHMQTEVLRPDYSAFGGGMSLRWEF